MQDIVINEIAKQGMLGLVVAFLLFVLWKIATRYDALQEKRISESLANHKITADLTQAVKDLTATLRERG